MASKYSICALLLVAFVATAVIAGKGKKDKMVACMSCLTMESANSTMEKMNATMAECMAELGLAPNATADANAEAATTGKPSGEPERHKPDFCFMECMMRKNGLVKDGSFVLEEYAKVNMKPEYLEKFQSEFNECLTKEGLPTTYTVKKEDQCKSMEKYFKCMHKASKVCRAKDSSSSEEN